MKSLFQEKKSPCLSRHFLVANPSVVETSKKRLALNPGKLKVSSKKNGSTKQKKDKIEAEIPTTCSNMYSEYQEKGKDGIYFEKNVKSFFQFTRCIKSHFDKPVKHSFLK